MKKLFILFFVASCFITCKNTSDEPILLRINLKKGEKFDIKYTLKSRDEKTPFTIESKSKVWVDEVYGNIFKCRVNVLSLKMESKTSDGEISYNSSKKTEEMSLNELSFHEKFKDNINKDYLFEVNAKGGVSTTFTDENGNYAYSDDIPVDLDGFFPDFPDKSVKPGETWDGNGKSINGNDYLKITYTLEEITKNKVIISFVSVSNKLYTESEAIAKGKYIIDKEKGRLTEFSLETIQDLSKKEDVENKIKITQTMEVTD